MKQHDFTRIVVLVTVSFIGSCTNTPAPSAPAATTPVPEKAAEPVSDSVSRADALLAEMRQREAEFAKLERDLPKVPPPPLPDQRVFGQPTASPAAPSSSAPAATAPTPANVPGVASGRDETWWKDQARAIGLRLDEAERLAAAAAVAVNSATLRITQDEARAQYLTRLAAVNTIKAELTNLQEDARRAGVPPGWLRWP